MSIYKIRNKITGMFSTGGYSPRWTKNGKSWSRKSDLSAHLSLHPNMVYNYYTNAEIVVFEVCPTGTISVREWAAEADERRSVRITKEKEQLEVYRRQQREKELARILEQYPQLQLKQSS